MTNSLGLTCSGPLGFQDGPVDITLKNVTAGAFVLGRVVQLDLALVDADTTNLKFGAVGSGYNHCILPQAGASGITGRRSIFGALLAAIAAGDSGKVRLAGKARVLCLDAGAGNAWTRGEEGVVTAAGVINFDPAGTGRVVGRAESAATSAVEVLADVFFEGLLPAVR